MNKYSSDIFKFILGWLVVFAVRLIPFRAPNIEPVLAVAMPFSKKYGAVGGFLFGSLSVLIFDIATGKLGQWTLITAAAYGLVGALSYFYFRKRESSRRNYVIFGIAGTIFYDAVTGLSIGPLFFGQPLNEAFFGQISFTLWHLLGNVSFALILSPAIYRWVVENKLLEVSEASKIIKKYLFLFRN